MTTPSYGFAAADDVGKKGPKDLSPETFRHNVGMKRPTVAALCASILLVPIVACSSDSSGTAGENFSDGTDYQFWYNHGYEFVDGVIEVDQEYGEDAREECVVNADLMGETDADRDALMDGCDARLAEE